ncbi:MAG: flagellar hook-basal body protein [Myxococcota bacterium]
MSRDIYSSLSGAMASWDSMEVVANNLANADTTGFKASKIAFATVGDPTHVLGEAYAEGQPPARDDRDGAVVSDAVPTHFALRGAGYFTLQQGDQQVLTRDGRFSVSSERQLVDANGAPVLGEGGPIEIPDGETIRVGQDGTIYGSQSGELDRLRVVTATDVTAIGSNRFTANGPVAASDASVVQGGLESSNVDPLAAMVELVQASRYFEAYQKAIQASDELDSRLNQMGGR